LTIANIITFARILAIPLLATILSLPLFSYQKELSALIFCLIIFSDFLDGYVARKFNQTTNLGKILDPLADKILVTTMLVFYTEQGLIPFYWTSLIIFREYSVMGLRVIASMKKIVIKADFLGKIKTVLQFSLILCLILNIKHYSFVLYFTVLITFLSGINYFYSNRKALYG
jgi:CDP-diacylglycerol---glycerol-3-phosphate 3-phosphatidyltransferase